MAFSINELDINADSTVKQIRNRQIFEVLKTKAINREFLTEHEKEFFYIGVKFSFLNDGKIEDYDCCDNPKFKFLYLVYSRDIYGFKKHIITKPSKDIVKKEERKSDLFYLKIKIEEWKSIIKKEVHVEKLLHESAKETRVGIKGLKKLYKYKNIQGIYTANYIAKENAIILHSKWIYCVALEILEASNPSDFAYELNEIRIEFNENSLIHILNRHFAKILKEYDTKKSFHKEIFIPRILSPQIKKIISIIDNSKFLVGKQINKIAFKFDGQDYIIYTSEKKRDENTHIRLINTFSPVGNNYEKSILVANYNLEIINHSFSVYVPK